MAGVGGIVFSTHSHVLVCLLNSATATHGGQDNGNLLMDFEDNPYFGGIMRVGYDILPIIQMHLTCISQYSKAL